jgi:hypothetical protein
MIDRLRDITLGEAVDGDRHDRAADWRRSVGISGALNDTEVEGRRGR